MGSKTMQSPGCRIRLGAFVLWGAIVALAPSLAMGEAPAGTAPEPLEELDACVDRALAKEK